MMSSDRKNAPRREVQSSLYRGNHLLFALLMTVNVLMNSVNLVFSWLMQKLVDIAAGQDMTPLPGVLRLCLVVFSAFFALYLLWRHIRPLFLYRAMTQYKACIFEKLTQKSISSFSRENTSRYISALTNDATVIERDYLPSLIRIAAQAMLFLGSLAMMLYYSPLLTAIAIGLAVLPVMGSLAVGNRMGRAEEAVSGRNEAFVGTVKDLLSGFSVVKSFRAEKQALRLFARENDSTEQAKRRKNKLEATIEFITTLTSVTAQLGVFIIGAYLALSGRGVTPGVVVVFLQLMNFILTPILDLPAILAKRRSAVALMDKIGAALQENVRGEGESIPPLLTEGITLENVSFGYEAGETVLHGVSFTFEAGKSYALVGASGSGKSTLLNLMMGAYSGYDGRILIDGHELRSVSAESLYALLTLVQQNVFIFNDTILNNVTMFREFDSRALETALAQSGLSALIRERGAAYLCGENGCQLSGGERQRISIARALLQNSPVLLLDEATAALDAQTADEVTDAVLSIAGRTRVVVTHRLEESQLRRYDAIVVLRGGRICEQGSFDALMAQKGMLYSLYTVAKQ